MIVCENLEEMHICTIKVNLDILGKLNYPMLTIKRIYEKHKKADGFRILVDRIWPRGVSKAKANLDLWLKEIAPSNTLRKWFKHDPKKWATFQKRYKTELKKDGTALAELKKILRKRKTITLLYAARDQEHNEAKVLKNILLK